MQVGTWLGLVVCLSVVALVRCQCTMPSKQELKKQWQDALLNTCDHYTLLMASPFLQISLNKSMIHRDIKFECPNVAQCDPTLDTCTACDSVPGDIEYPPSAPSTNPGDPLRKRSHCPWRYVSTSNSVLRYPHVIVEAQCLTSQCLGQANSTGNTCDKVYFYIPVLVNTQQPAQDGKCVFKHEMYKLQTGCTCAKVLTAS